MDRDERLIAYLQGRLDAEARAAVEREAAADPALAAEIAALASARARFAQDAEAAGARREAGWRRLSAALALETQAPRPLASRPQAPTPLAPDSPVPGSLASDAKPVAAPRAANDDRPWRPSLAQAAGIAILAVGLWQATVVPLLRPLDEGYRTVGEAAETASLQVLFRADAPLGEVSALLRDLDARVVDGPGALGLWRLSFEGTAARDAAAEALGARPDLVETVAAP
ncbi:MAG: hypothetical protein AAFU61_07080 [Pseudomonadota bacterium]